MLSYYGLVKVLRVKAYTCREPSGLWGLVRNDTHSFGWETGVMTPLLTMSSRVHSICSWYSMGTLHWACCTGSMEGSVMMV